MRALAFPFHLGLDTRLSVTENYALIVRGQIIDALMTNFGERVFRPRYGCDIQAALFDPADELVRADAAGQIKTRLETLVPRAFIRGVRVRTGSTDEGIGYNTVIIDVVYRATLYSTDTTVAVPVASEFLTRQRALHAAGAPSA